MASAASKTDVHVVLLWNSHSQRKQVLNFVLGTNDLDIDEPDSCYKIKGSLGQKELVLINTPVKLLSKNAKDLLENLVGLSAPGPHIFMLVLQPEDFTEQQKKSLNTILRLFSDDALKHLMVLVLKPKVDGPYAENPNFLSLKEICGDRILYQEDINRSKLIKCFDEILKENDGEHLSLHTSKVLHGKSAFSRINPNKHEKSSEEFDSWYETRKTHNPSQEESTKKQKKEDVESPDCLKIVLIGKTGCGKSSTGNTILGRDEFHAECSQMSVTKTCQKQTSKVDGRSVTVVDTPGLFDSTLSNEEVMKHMASCISLLAPGPHVFLLVFRIGRFTPEEKETLKLVQKAFGKNSAKFTIVLLTGGEILDREKSSIEDYIKSKCDDSFKKLVSDCGGRLHVFNNLKKDNHTQVSKLIEMIDSLVKANGGKCFTNEDLQDAETSIKKEMERILSETEEEMKEIEEELEREREREVEAMKKRIEDQRERANEERKERENQLKLKAQNIRELEIMKMRVEMGEEPVTEDRVDERQKDLENEQKERWNKFFKEKDERQLSKTLKIKKLKEEYKREKEKIEMEAKEEEWLRRQQEEKEREDLMKKYKKYIQQLKVVYEEKARQQAEEHNKFMEEYKKRKGEMYNALKCIIRKRENIKKFSQLLKKQEQEMKSEEDEQKKRKLQEEHEQELDELIQEVLSKDKKQNCPIL